MPPSLYAAFVFLLVLPLVVVAVVFDWLGDPTGLLLFFVFFSALSAFFLSKRPNLG